MKLQNAVGGNAPTPAADPRLTPTTGTVPIEVCVWWIPDCGHLHVETNPKAIGPICPDGIKDRGSDDR